MGAPFLRDRLAHLLEIGVLLAGVATFAGWLGGLWWALDLASHFRFQYAASLAIAGAVALIFRRWKLASAALFLAALNAAAIAPYFPAGRRDAPPHPDAIRIVSLNVHTSNTEYDRVLRHLLARDPDVAFLMEINAEWAARLQPLIHRYPHTLILPREDNFGLALLTRLPVDSLAELELGAAGVPSAVLRGANLSIIATHPLPPASRENAELRDEQLADLATAAREIRGPLVVIGDLNATPWSAPFRRLTAETGLSDSGRGRGWHPTWVALS